MCFHLYFKIKRQFCGENLLGFWIVFDVSDPWICSESNLCWWIQTEPLLSELYHRPSLTVGLCLLCVCRVLGFHPVQKGSRTDGRSYRTGVISSSGPFLYLLSVIAQALLCISEQEPFSLALPQGPGWHHRFILADGCWMAHCADGLDPVPSCFLSSLYPPVSLCLSVARLVYTHCPPAERENTQMRRLLVMKWHLSACEVFFCRCLVAGLFRSGCVKADSLLLVCVSWRQESGAKRNWGRVVMVWEKRQKGSDRSAETAAAASHGPGETKQVQRLNRGFGSGRKCVWVGGVEERRGGGGGGGGWGPRPELRIAAVDSLT